MKGSHVITVIVIILIIIGIVLLIVYWPSSKKSESFTPNYVSRVLSNKLKTIETNCAPKSNCGVNGNVWNDIIKRRDLLGTGVQQTNKEFVEKAKRRSYATTNTKYQEFDHDRELITQCGLRRYNNWGKAKNFPGPRREVNSERDSDYPIKPTIGLTFPPATVYRDAARKFDVNEI